MNNVDCLRNIQQQMCKPFVLTSTVVFNHIKTIIAFIIENKTKIKFYNKTIRFNYRIIDKYFALNHQTVLN